MVSACPLFTIATTEDELGKCLSKLNEFEVSYVNEMKVITIVLVFEELSVLDF